MYSMNKPILFFYPVAFQKFDGFLIKKKYRFLMVYNGFQWLHNEKKPGAGEKFGNPFF